MYNASIIVYYAKICYPYISHIDTLISQKIDLNINYTLRHISIEKTMSTNKDENTVELDSSTQEQSNNSTEATAEGNTSDDNKSEEITYSLSLDNVNYNSTFRTNKGALAQLVMNLNDMKTRLDKPTENNQVQGKLYPVIENICNRLYNKYVDMTSNVSEDHVREFSYFLMGPYGNGTLRHPTAIRAERKMYKYSELGPTFRAMSNRLSHALREVESRLESEKYSGDVESYTALKVFLTDFDTELKECSEDWKNTVYKVREEEGIEKKEKPVTKFRRHKKNFKSGDSNNENSQGYVKFRRRGLNEQSAKQNEA